MAVFYDENISYNEPSVAYEGFILIKIPSTNSQITIPSAKIKIVAYQDINNQTTIGVISYDLAATGILEIVALQEQANALIEAVEISSSNNLGGYVNISSVSYGETTVEVSTQQSSSSSVGLVSI
jgi:hypothetical protein